MADPARGHDQAGGPDPTAAVPAARSRTSRGGWLGGLLLVVALGFVAVALIRNWTAVRADLAAMSWTDLLGSGLAATGAMLLTALSWRILLAGLGSPMPLHPALTLFAAGQLGKYVPGAVWVVAIQAEMGRRQGIARSVMALSYLLAVLVSIGSGGLVGVLTLLSAQGSSLGLMVPLVAALAVLTVVALVWPRPINAALRWGAAKVGRELPEIALPGPVLAASFALVVAAWGLFGLHAWLLARPLGAGLDLLAPTTGAFALAFVAGLVLVPLPAGLGLREGVLVAILGGSLGASAALTVGLVSRLVLVVVDVALAALLGVPQLAGVIRGRGDRSG